MTLYYDPETKRPQFIQPPTEPLRVSKQLQDEMREEIRQLVDLGGSDTLDAYHSALLAMRVADGDYIKTLYPSPMDWEPTQHITYHITDENQFRTTGWYPSGWSKMIWVSGVADLKIGELLQDTSTGAMYTVIEIESATKLVLSKDRLLRIFLDRPLEQEIRNQPLVRIHRTAPSNVQITMKTEGLIDKETVEKITGIIRRELREGKGSA